MGKARGYAICGGIVGFAAIYATTRGDLGFAAPMFLVAALFAVRANRAWSRMN